MNVEINCYPGPSVVVTTEEVAALSDELWRAHRVYRQLYDAHPDGFWVGWDRRYVAEAGVRLNEMMGATTWRRGPCLPDDDFGTHIFCGIPVYFAHGSQGVGVLASKLLGGR